MRDGKIYLPKVNKEVRDHFGCRSYFGMPIENNGGSGSAGSHWEREVLGFEYMTEISDL